VVPGAPPIFSATSAALLSDLDSKKSTIANLTPYTNGSNCFCHPGVVDATQDRPRSRRACPEANAERIPIPVTELGRPRNSPNGAVTRMR